MKLISCHVENFGRLHDFDYVFSDGVNVICRENGWGKSTFAAFLVAMFYGLPAKGKSSRTANSRNGLYMANGRTVYKPWQGGVFGGRLVFEAGGKTLEVTRIFGAREAEDEFDLRDTDTNLPCFDYTKNLGRELFLLDRASFLRTVCTAQQDCETEATDDVNALIADLADYAGDMDSYEAAQRRLKEAANRLTPKRATGRLNRLEAQIGDLEQRIAAAGDIEDRIDVCGQDLKELEQKRAALETERARLGKAIAEAERIEKETAEKERAEKELPAKRQIWQRLYGTCERRREELKKVSAHFPGRVPSRAEVDALLLKCREMERLEERMQTEMLSEEEQERLTALEERFCSAPDPSGIGPEGRRESPVPEEGRNRARLGGEKQRGPDSRADSRMPFPGEHGSNALLPAGIMLFAAGALLLLLLIPADAGEKSRILLPLLAAAAIIFVAAGAAMAAAGLLKRDMTAGSQGRDPASGFENEINHPSDYAGNSPGSDETNRAYAEYLYLERKEQKLERTHADWAQARKPILLFLKELGFPPEEDLHSVLTSIRDAADDCEDARTLFKEAREELRLFEEELRRNGLTVAEVQRAEVQRTEVQRAEVQKTEVQKTEIQSAKAQRAEGKRADFSISPDETGHRKCPGKPVHFGEPAQSERSMQPEKSMQSGKSTQSGETMHSGKPTVSSGDVAVLRQRREQAHEELLQCRSKAADEERRMEDLVSEREERDSMLSELQELRRQRETDLAEYRHVTMAATILKKARESMTARYADPIRTSFCRYWEMIAGYSAAGVYVDANTNITVEERGKQRDSSLLSTGWRDLAGICLRTALADAMYPAGLRERPPLILDDPFTNLDDEKTKGAMRFLAETGRQYQILYFTCSSARC